MHHVVIVRNSSGDVDVYGPFTQQEAVTCANTLSLRMLEVLDDSPFNHEHNKLAGSHYFDTEDGQTWINAGELKTLGTK